MQSYNPTRTYLLAQVGLMKDMVRGDGHWLYDRQGRQYLDFLSQYGVVSLGHNHPELVAALQAALAEQRPAMIQPFVAEATAELAEKLREITPGDLSYTVFTNSGAEAVETAIKLARVRTGREVIVSTIGGFHGKTLGALSATGNPAYQVPFGAPSAGFEYIPFGDVDALAAKLQSDGQRIAAFIVEPVQGEGGMVPAPDGYLAEAVGLCRSAGGLTIFDEVQTGLGRTGAMFAAETASAAPDIMLLGKALGGGLLPLAACVVTPSAWDHTFGRLHSSTFAGNQLACVVGSKVIDLLLADDGKLVRRVADSGQYLLDRLKGLGESYPDILCDVRGAGLMTGVEFHPFDGDGGYSMGFASRNGLMTMLLSGFLLEAHGIVTAPVLSNPDFLRLEPPFTVGRVEIDRVVDALETICETVRHGDYHHLFRHLTNVGQQSRPTGLYISSVADRAKTEDAESRERRKHTFAFLIHYATDFDYVRTDPAFGNFSDGELQRWQQWVSETGPGVIEHIEHLRSTNGATAEGCLLALPMVPRQLLEMSRNEMTDVFARAVKVAKDQGAGVLGLGAFTSVVTRGGERVVGQGIAVTTGNCLTSVMAAEAIEAAAETQGRRLADMHVAVVGAGGAIGRLTALLLAEKVGTMTLIGNAGNPDGHRRCRLVAGDLYRRLIERIGRNGDSESAGPIGRAMLEAGQRETLPQHPSSSREGNLAVVEAVEVAFKAAGMDAPVLCSCDMATSIAGADVVLLATNSDRALVGAEHLKKDAIVCDVARPSNVAEDLPDRRPDVFVFEGGLVELPHPVDFGRDFQILPPGTTLGCLAESILLAMEGDENDRSIGQTLAVEEAEYIRALADKHGFRAASPDLCRKRPVMPDQ
ncbi:MAG: aminotransferase class III-fold pyridoxal phosphate-dependent enzyme [Planctomycetota bacterium]